MRMKCYCSLHLTWMFVGFSSSSSSSSNLMDVPKTFSSLRLGIILLLFEKKDL